MFYIFIALFGDDYNFGGCAHGPPTCAHHRCKGYGFLQRSFNSLSDTITTVEERLSVLEGIVRTLIRRADSSGNLEVRKLAWLKKKGKVEALL